MALSLRSHDDQRVATYIDDQLRSVTILHGVLVGDCLRSHDASTAFIVISRRFHTVLLAIVLTTALTLAFCGSAVLLVFTTSFKFLNIILKPLYWTRWLAFNLSTLGLLGFDQVLLIQNQF